MMRMMRVREICVLAILAMLAVVVPTGYADGECGPKVNGTSDDCGCAPGYCCSIYGYCGTTPDYCDDSKCQCQCPTPPPPASPPPPYTPPPPVISPDITEIITSELFEQLLLHRDDTACPARGFYYYDAFVQAARIFPGFATTGSIEDRKREVAAFLGQTSHETTGGWDGAPDGRYAWGYCFKTEVGNPADMPSYCQESVEWPCAAGKKYYGRGPIQLSYNYNYGPCGEALGLDLLGNPDLVAEDTTISFETAIWFWMTPQSPKPSCHDVILGKWEPSPADIAANRLPGYGVITNIINGGLECNTHKLDDRVKDRIGFYLRYCKILGVSPGPNLDCRDQVPFGSGLFLNSM